MQATAKKQFIVVRQLASAFGALSTYAAGHPTLTNLLQNFHDLLADYLDSSGPLILDVKRDNFYVAEEPVEQHEGIQRLAIQLLKLRIIKVAFFPGITTGEIDEFLNTVRGRDARISENLKKTMARAGIEKIRIEQLETESVGDPGAGQKNTDTPDTAEQSDPPSTATGANPIAADITNPSLTHEVKARKFSSTLKELGDFFEDMEDDETREEWFTDLFRDVKAADPELQKALKSSVPEGKKWVFERISKELGKAVSEAAAQPKLDPTKDRLPSALSNLSESTASSIEPINVEETDMLLQPGALTQYTEVNLSDSAVAAEVAATVLEMLPFSEVAETREKSMRVLEESVGSFNDPEALCDILIGIDDMVRATMQGDAYKEMLENLYAGLIKSDALNLIIQAGSQADLRPKGGRALRILGSAALQPIIERIIRSGSDAFRTNTSALLDETGWDYCTKIGNRMRGSNTTLAKNAATVLGLIGTEEALRLLHTALDQASPRLAPTILRAIGNHDSDAATNILAEALSGNSQHRELAAKVLAGRPDSRAHTILCDFVAARIIKNRDMAARKAAIIAMSEADSAEFDKCLQQMIRTTRVLWGKQWETLKTVAGQELARKTSKTVAGTNQ